MTNPTGAENAQVRDDEPKVKHVMMWVCEPCLRGDGLSCNTPGCIFIRMSPPEWELDSNQYQNATTALRESRREGMLDVVQELRDMGASHRKMAEYLLKSNPAMSEMQKIRAEECEDNANTIERAAMDTEPEK